MRSRDGQMVETQAFVRFKHSEKGFEMGSWNGLFPQYRLSQMSDVQLRLYLSLAAITSKIWAFLEFRPAFQKGLAQKEQESPLELAGGFSMKTGRDFRVSSNLPLNISLTRLPVMRVATQAHHFLYLNHLPGLATATTKTSLKERWHSSSEDKEPAPEQERKGKARIPGEAALNTRADFAKLAAPRAFEVYATSVRATSRDRSGVPLHPRRILRMMR
jgi:hypothetical protein